MPSEINGALVTLLLTIVALWLRLVKTLLDSRMEPSGRRSCYYLDRVRYSTLRGHIIVASERLLWALLGSGAPPDFRPLRVQNPTSTQHVTSVKQGFQKMVTLFHELE